MTTKNFGRRCGGKKTTPAASRASLKNMTYKKPLALLFSSWDLFSAMTHIKLGQETEARKEVAEALKIWPQYSLEMERN